MTIAACEGLVREGLVEIAPCPRPKEAQVLSEFGARAALRDDSAWLPDNSGNVYELTTTPAGDAALDATWADERKYGRRWPHTI